MANEHGASQVHNGVPIS